MVRTAWSGVDEYLWELVANCLEIEPWSPAGQAAAKELRDARFEPHGLKLEEE